MNSRRVGRYNFRRLWKHIQVRLSFVLHIRVQCLFFGVSLGMSYGGFECVWTLVVVVWLASGILWSSASGFYCTSEFWLALRLLFVHLRYVDNVVKNCQLRFQIQDVLGVIISDASESTLRQKRNESRRVWDLFYTSAHNVWILVFCFTLRLEPENVNVLV